MKNTREQNFETVEELKMFLGVNQLIDEIVKYFDSSKMQEILEDIKNLWVWL